jgi:hypothetical protein
MTQYICDWSLPCTSSFLSWCKLCQIDPDKLVYDATLFEKYFPKEIPCDQIIFTRFGSSNKHWVITIESPTFDMNSGLSKSILHAMSTWIQNDLQKEYFAESKKCVDPPQCYAVLSIS